MMLILWLLTLLFRSVSTQGNAIKKMHILNKVNHIWHFGSSSREGNYVSYLDVVYLSLYDFLILLSPWHFCFGDDQEYCDYAGYLMVLMVDFSRFALLRNDFEIVDHVSQDKRAAIAVTVDSLGEGIHPAIRNGWLAYVKRAYPDAAAAAPAAAGQGPQDQ
jgi:hypothetical protein